MALTDHEKRVIKAFMVDREAKGLGPLSEPIWPDEQIRDKPACDAAFMQAGKPVALEHTSVDVYVGQRKWSTPSGQYGLIEAGVRETLLPALPHDIACWVTIPDSAFKKVPWPEIGRAIGRAIAADLPNMSEDEAHKVQVRVGDLDFQVHATLETPLGNGIYMRMLSNRPSEVELGENIRTTLHAKLPKLQACSAADCLRILLLEQWDYANTNDHEFEKVVTKARNSGEFPFWPDEVHWALTMNGAPMRFRRLT